MIMRIKEGSSMFTFVDKNGNEITGHRYLNPDGTLGGWVAANSVLGPNVHVELGATVGPGEIIPPGTRVLAQKPIRVEDITDDDGVGVESH